MSAESSQSIPPDTSSSSSSTATTPAPSSVSPANPPSSSSSPAAGTTAAAAAAATTRRAAIAMLDPTHQDILSLEYKLWSNEFDAVTTALESTRFTNPRHAELYAEVLWIKSVVTQKKDLLEESYSLFRASSKLAELCLKDFPGHLTFLPADVPVGSLSPQTLSQLKIELQLVLADSAFFAGACLGRLGKQVKAGWRMKQSWTIYSTLTKQYTADPAGFLPSAVAVIKFGTGVFLWTLSWLPPIVVKVLEVLNFQADRVKGVSLLKEVAAGESIRAPMSALLLCVNFFILPRALYNVNTLLAEADPILNKAMTRWPKSPLFHWMISFALRKRGDAAGALTHIQEAIASLAASTGAPVALELDSCSCLLMEQRWTEAKQVLEKLVTVQGKGTSVYGMTSTLYAACLQQMGQKDAAMKIMSQIPPEKELVGPDKMASAFAERYTKRSSGATLFPFELLYMRRDIAHLNPISATKFLQGLENGWKSTESSISKDAKGREETALYKLLHGAILRCLGAERLDEASKDIKEAAEEALKKGKEFKQETHVACFANLELAEMQYNKKSDPNYLQETERLLTIANKHCGGWFEDMVKPRIKIALAQIHQEIAAATQQKAK